VKRGVRIVKVVFFAVSFSVLSVTANAAPSVDDLTRFPEFEYVKISPSGKYLAATRRTKEHEGISIIDLESMKAITGRHFGENQDIWDFTWATDEKLLVEPAIRYPNTMSYKAPTGELFSMNADGSKIVYIFGYRAGQYQTGTNIGGRQADYGYGDVIDVLVNDPDYVVIGASTSGTNKPSRAFKLNIRTGKKQTIGRSKNRYGSFVTGHDGRVSINFGENSHNIYELYHREDGDGEFSLHFNSKYGQGKITPIAPVPNSDNYYVYEDKDGAMTGLSVWDPKTKKVSLLYRNENVDVAGALISERSRELYAVRYFDHTPKFFYPDPEHPLAKIHKQLSELFVNEEVSITSETDDYSKLIVQVTGDKNPGVFYFFDAEKNKLQLLFKKKPWVDPDELSGMHAFEVKARDGTNLRGYITLPVGSDNKNLPMVVMVHGGPHGVSTKWGYDEEAQIFAAKGYAVLQVNYRGSGGYGRVFEASGYGKWGAEMQNDVTDATRWAIGAGIADKNRICIYGGSYGAYTALFGVAKEPDLYQCAIGYAGVYDLPLLYLKGDIQGRMSGVRYLRAVIGEDEEALKTISPVYNAEKIKAKVLLVHGKIDRRAPIKHAYRMRDALKEQGNAPEMIIENKEGHGFFGEKTRRKLFEKMVRFLDENIGDKAKS